MAPLEPHRDEHQAPPPGRGRESSGGLERRIPLPVLVAPVVALGVLGVLGDVLWPTLAADHPLALIAVNPRTRYLVLASPYVDVVPFTVVAMLRSLVGDPFAYLLGRRYGDRLVDLVVARAGRRQGLARRLVALARRAGVVPVLLAPGGAVCALVGAAGMGPVVFMAANVGGTLVRVMLVRLAGDAFADPLSEVVEWVGRYRWPLMAAMAAAILAHRLGNRRSTEEELSLADAVAELEREGDPR